MGGLDECAQAYVRHEILSYLDHAPRASDTVDGIIDWWLHQQRLHIGRETILTALAQLVRAGQLRQQRLPAGTIVYAKPVSPSKPSSEE